MRRLANNTKKRGAGKKKKGDRPA